MRMRRTQHLEMQHLLHWRHVERVARLPRHDRLGEWAAEAGSAGAAGDILFDRFDAVERVDDALIARAAAEIAFEHARQVAARCLVEGCGCHDHAGGAEAALKRLRIDKRLLHGMQLAVFFQTLDRRDFAPGSAKRRHQAAMERRAVEPDGAGAAVSRIAAFLDAEASLLAQEGAQALAGSRLRRDALAVEGELHVSAPSRSSARICSAK